MRPAALAVLLASMTSGDVGAQVSSYTFTQEVGTWQPIAGSGTPLGMPGLPAWIAFDDNSFVTQGESLPMGSATTGNGWPIGFDFHFNGHTFDRVGLSMEGWLSFGHSSDGTNAVYVPFGSTAYTPLSSPVPAQIEATKRNRVAAFSMDLAAQGNGGTWPIQIHRAGLEPNRMFIAEWNVVRSGGSNAMNFQIWLMEGGGDPAAQVVQVKYNGMAQTQALLGQVGLAGDTPADFNNRMVGTSPFNWAQSQAGTSNTATCRLPSSAANIPQGLTFTWTPPACRVYGIAVDAMAISGGVISATLSWDPVAGATSYSYVVTAGGPNDTPIQSGTGLTGTSVQLNDLPAGQQLYAYVRSDCGAGPGGWGSGNAFTTERVVEVICGGNHLSDAHCYADLEETQWHYTSSAGSPLRLIIHAGTIQGGDLLRVYDGPTDQAPLLYSSATGAIAGQVVNSTGAHLTMKLVADASGSCMMHDFILPMEWEVGCVDCEPIFAGFEVVDDCPAGQFSVAVTVVSMGSATSASISSNAGSSPVAVPGVGQYTVGPFPIGTPVVVTVDHPGNSYCSSISGPLLNGNCPIIGCGPDQYDYCYGDMDVNQMGYTSGSSQRIGARFIAGSLATGDQLRFYDGPDVFSSLLLQVVQAGDLSGKLVTSTTASNMLLLEVASNNSGSCVSGHADEWKYIVACYDGCTQPAATYTVVDDCANGNFSIVVNVTNLGSGGSVVISDDVGVSSINANSTGSYTVGPYAGSSAVKVEVVGTSVLCTTNSPTLRTGCGVGMKELAQGQLTVYPNPGKGTFRLTMPHGFGGRSELDVLDLSGRRVAGEVVRQQEGQEVILQLDHLPVGSYVLMLRDERQVLTGRLVVVH